MSVAAVDARVSAIVEVVDFLASLSATDHWTDEQRERVAEAALDANDGDVGLAKLAVVASYLDPLESLVPPARDYCGSGA